MICDRIKSARLAKVTWKESVAGFQSLIHGIEPGLARVGICIAGYDMGYRLLTKGLQRARNRAW